MQYRAKDAQVRPYVPHCKTLARVVFVPVRVPQWGRELSNAFPLSSLGSGFHIVGILESIVIMT